MFMKQKNGWESKCIFKYEGHTFDFESMKIVDRDSGKTTTLLYTDKHDCTDELDYRLCYERADDSQIKVLVDEINDAYMEYVAERELLDE